MARLPALIDALTRCDDRPRGTIDHIARTMREAGLIQTTKRGRGAAEMTPLDAAALVLGLYGLAEASPDAIAKVQILAALKPQGETFRRRSKSGRPATLPAELRPLAKATTLLDAVAAMIELAPLYNGNDGSSDPIVGRFSLGFQLHRPLLRGDVTVAWLSPDLEQQVMGLRFKPPGRRPELSTEAYAVTTSVFSQVLTTLHDTLFLEAGSVPRP